MKIALVAFLTGTVACHQPQAATSAAKEAPPPVAAVAAPVVPSLPPPALAASAAAITIPAGKSLRIRTATALSTKTARTGEAFSAVLAAPLIVDGVTVARQGATIQGVVTNSHPGGRVKGVASISVRATRLELANGRSVDLVTNSFVQLAPHTKKKDALKIGVGSGVGAAIGAIAGGGSGAAIGAGVGAGGGTGAVLATRGDPALIPAESLLTLTLRRAITVTP